ncbi:MAG: hypothetical protein A2V90_07415 [Gammaproteobacteria bacterium RBG_16_57_12]|nr:MAG: hypothetical protein A2V90_07415 [Gammaproteobacteria bacterium RBG_16_57_12]
MRMLVVPVLWVLLIGASPNIAFPDTVTIHEHPKIGLVLGGGGARGAAHVGVLKVLEANHIPIDYIVGTSMGAIIGGLYAAGLSPETIEAQLQTIDWTAVLRDKPSRSEMAFPLKWMEYDFPVKLEAGYRQGRILFPRGLIAGQQLGIILETLAFPRSHIKDFDQLPIPFRAVATDMETGEMVVLDHGNLPAAMRASVSVPGAFAPEEIDGRLLVDGGLVNEVPIDVARQLGADILIVVNVGAPLIERSGLASLVGTSAQVLRIMTRKNTAEQLASLSPKDILITPDLQLVGSTEFVKAREAIHSGEMAAYSMLPALQQLSISEIDYRAFLDRQRAPSQPPPVMYFVHLHNASPVADEIINRQLHIPLNQPLDLDVLQQDLNRLYGMGDFERVTFVHDETHGRHGLQINAQRKPWGPHYLRLALDASDDFSGGSTYNVMLGITSTRLNPLGAEWRNKIQTGATRLISTEFYQPFDYNSRYFISPRIAIENKISDVYEDDHRIAQYQATSYSSGLDWGVVFDNSTELRIGMLRDRIEAGPRVGAADLPQYDIEQGAILTRLTYDRLDNINFPRHGAFARLEWFGARDGLGADVSYDKLTTEINKPVTYTHYTVLSSLRIGSSLGSPLPFYDEFSLGGFLSLSGMQRGQLTGQRMALGRMMFYRQTRNPSSIRFAEAFYLGGSLELGGVWENNSELTLQTMNLAGSLLAGADTVIGPLYLAYGYTQGGHHAAYLYLGRVF